MEKLHYFVTNAYYTFTNKHWLVLLKSRIMQYLILSVALILLSLSYIYANFTLYNRLQWPWHGFISIKSYINLKTYFKFVQCVDCVPGSWMCWPLWINNQLVGLLPQSSPMQFQHKVTSRIFPTCLSVNSLLLINPFLEM